MKKLLLGLSLLLFASMLFAAAPWPISMRSTNGEAIYPLIYTGTNVGPFALKSTPSGSSISLQNLGLGFWGALYNNDWGYATQIASVYVATNQTGVGGFIGDGSGLTNINSGIEKNAGKGTNNILTQLREQYDWSATASGGYSSNYLTGNLMLQDWVLGSGANGHRAAFSFSSTPGDQAYGALFMNSQHGGGNPNPIGAEWQFVSASHIALCPGGLSAGDGHIQVFGGVGTINTNKYPWLYSQGMRTVSDAWPLGFSGPFTWRTDWRSNGVSLAAFPGIYSEALSTNGTADYALRVTYGIDGTNFLTSGSDTHSINNAGHHTDFVRAADTNTLHVFGHIGWDGIGYGNGAGITNIPNSAIVGGNNLWGTNAATSGATNANETGVSVLVRSNTITAGNITNGTANIYSTGTNWAAKARIGTTSETVHTLEVAGTVHAQGAMYSESANPVYYITDTTAASDDYYIAADGSASWLQNVTDNRRSVEFDDGAGRGTHYGPVVWTNVAAASWGTTLIESNTITTGNSTNSGNIQAATLNTTGAITAAANVNGLNIVASSTSVAPVFRGASSASFTLGSTTTPIITVQATNVNIASAVSATSVTATNGYSSRSNVFFLAPTNTSTAGQAIVATGLEGSTTHTKWGDVAASGGGTVSNIVAVVASANWTNVLWDSPETGDHYFTNLLTFTIPRDGLYSVGAGYSTPEGAGVDCAESWLYLRYQTRDGTWIVSDGIQNYPNPGTSEPSWFPQVNGYAGQTMIVSNYCLESYDGGGDRQATNYVRTYIYGPTNLAVNLTTSINYPTNLLGTTPTFSYTAGVVYQYLTTNATFQFLAPANVGFSNVQTCVLTITNSAASTINMIAPANVFTNGTWNVTNGGRTRITWTVDPWETNAVAFPLR